jgi:predicted RNase H-like HicB family nuclease
VGVNIFGETIGFFPVPYYFGIVVENGLGGFHGYCRDLPGLHVGGETWDETKRAAEDAVKAYVESVVKELRARRLEDEQAQGQRVR